MHECCDKNSIKNHYTFVNSIRVGCDRRKLEKQIVYYFHFKLDIFSLQAYGTSKITVDFVSLNEQDAIF